MRLSHESKMADEEDDFVVLGTPFEQLEEDAPRKKPVPLHEQVVTDDHGRRRFHGAFTGGFSAGYFNTVDTKEGWTPKTFVSSRSQKATERFAQRPEDFMDEEDLSEFGIAPKRVVTTQKFLPSRSDDGTSGKRPSVSGGIGSALLGANLLQDIIVPVKMSVGIKLLNQMGWKEGQGVGPRVRREAKKTYGCAGPPGTGPNKPEDEEDVYAVGLFFAPKDVESFEFTSKDDLHGIGYSGIDPKSALLSQRDWLGMDTSASSIGIRGQGFGVGALEEDDEDVYAQDHLSKYDIELSTSKPQSRNDLHGWSGPQQTSGLGGMLSIFCKASRPPPPRRHYPPPAVPRDFKPFHKPEEAAQIKQPLSGPPVHQKIQGATQTSKRLTAKERGEALGEVPLPTPKKSIFYYIAEEDKTRLKESKEKANSSKYCAKTRENSDLDRRFTSTVPLSTSGFKPFTKEPEKQARYEQYLSGKSDKDMPSQTDSKMTEWERKCEMEEFARAAALYRPLNQTMAARFTSAKDTDEKQNEEDSGKKDKTTAAKMKMFGTLTRERFEWHPDRVLCKRLNIPNPYPGSGVTGVVTMRREKSKTKEVTREVKAIDYKPHSSQSDRDEGADETEMVQKPSALVAGFQSIVTQQKIKQSSNQDTFVETSTERTDKEDLKTSEQNAESDANVIKRAPMDLFNEIFAESSSESESESEENEEVKESKTVELDVQNKEEKTDGIIKTKEALPVSDVPVHASGEGTPQLEPLEREKEPSPETFGPALPSSFGSSTAYISKGFPLSTWENSPKRQEKQKRKKKKKRKEKNTGSGISDSDDGYGRRRKEKKKRSKKKGSDFTDSDGEYTGKTRNKKRNTKYKASDSSNSESERSTRRRKNKIRSKYNDSEEKYGRRKKKTRPQDANDENSSDDEQAKNRKKKRKEKSAKDRKKYSDKTKKSDQQEYEEIQYESEEYIERNVQNVWDEKSFKSFESPEGSRPRKSNYHEKNRDEASEEDARNSTNSRTDNDSAKKQDISRVPANKEIIDKLKNIQMLKEKKRMRAADFM